MSFWSQAAFVAAGAALGYLASARGEQIGEAARSLASREQAGALMPRNASSALQKAWASDASAPVRRGVLRAVRFAATVRQGMTEKEDELNRRYSEQKERDRPGDPRTWGQTPVGAARHLARTEHPEGVSGAGEIIDARDADLPPDFFTGNGEERDAPPAH